MLSLLDGRVVRLKLPLPFELSEVNAYLVKLRDGWMLIDTGLDTPECHHAIESQLKQAGVALASIRRILLTHSHPDHIGGARRLLALTGAELLMEAAEVRHLAMVNSGAEWLNEPLYRGGVPAEMVTRIENSFAQIRPQFHPLKPDRILNQGDVLDTAIGPLEVITTPGHASGHATLWNEPNRVLFCGDTVLENISPNISWMAGRDMLGEYFTSLGRLGEMDADWLFPGHYVPFRGHREWIRGTLAHHEERCDQIVRALASGPRSAHQIAGVVWPRQLAPFHHRFAVFEILAHLEFLRRRERVRCEQVRASQGEPPVEVWVS